MWPSFEQSESTDQKRFVFSYPNCKDSYFSYEDSSLSDTYLAKEWKKITQRLATRNGTYF
jgi:hypothetical protein